MADQGNSVENLSQEQQQLLAALLEEEGIDLKEASAASRNEWPLSFTQQRLWVSGLRASGTAFGNLPLTFRLRGTLDVDGLKGALDALAARHSILRTSYPLHKGLAIQRVHTATQVPFRTETVERIETSSRLSAARILIEEEALRPFDLATEQPFRILLVRLDDNDHILLMLSHHIATDGWGIRILLKDLAFLYEHLKLGTQSDIAPIRLDYGSFARQQKKEVKQQRFADQLSYWQERLVDSPQSNDIPKIGSNNTHTPFAAVSVPVYFDEVLTASIRRVARESSSTVFMTLLACFQTFLSIYCDQKSTAVGTIISTRNRPGAEDTIGNFGNNVFIIAELEPSSTFKSVLSDVREQILGAQANQDIPLETLSDRSLGHETRSKVPHFQCMFIMRDSPLTSNLSMPELDIEEMDVEVNLMALDIDLDITDAGNVLTGFLAVNSSIANESLLEKLRDAWIDLVRDISGYPDKPLESLPNVKELHQLGEAARVKSKEKTPKEIDVPRAYCRVWVDVMKTGTNNNPDDQAQSWLIFADSGGIGEKIAEALRSAGHHITVVFMGDKSLESKDSTYRMAPEAGLAAYRQLIKQLVNDDSIPDRILHSWLLNPSNSFRPGSNLLHQNLEIGYLSLIDLSSALLEAGLGAKIPICVTSIGIHRFDKEPVLPERATALAAIETMTSLGIECHSIDYQIPEATESPSSWKKQMRDQILENLDRSELKGICAARLGKTLKLECTEITEDAAIKPATSGPCYLIANSAGELGQRLTGALLSQEIGKLILLADSSQSSESREDFVSDDSDATEVIIQYLVANMTDSDSIRDALDNVSSEQQITGAFLVLEDDSGSLISKSPASIAMQIQRYETFHQSIVNSRLESLTLVAHACEDSRSTVTESAVVEYFNSGTGDNDKIEMKTILFDENVSESEVWHKQFKTALLSQEPVIALSQLSPEITSETRVQQDVFARDAIEMELANHWSLALEKQNVPVNRSFFDLGGDSLMALKLFNKLQESYGFDWPLTVLIEAPTIAHLSRLVRSQKDLAEKDWNSVKTSQYEYAVQLASGPTENETPFFIAAGAFGNILNLRHLAQLIGEDRPVYGLQAKGLYGDTSPHTSFEEMAKDYLTEIRSIQPYGPYLLGGFCTGGITALEMARILELDGETVGSVIMIDTPAPPTDRVNGIDKLKIRLQKFRRGGFPFLLEWITRRIRPKVESSIFGVTNTEANNFQSEKLFNQSLVALRSYKPSDISVPVLQIRPVLSPQYHLGPNRVLDAKLNFIYPDNGWGSILSNFETIESKGPPGDHDGIVLEPTVRSFGHLLRLRLNQSN